MQHVVVIGGGITGTLTARELLLAGHRVTLLEGLHIGAGSSSRTAAGIRQQFSTMGTVRAMRHSVAFYQRFAEETEGHASPIVQNGYLFLYDEEAEWQTAVERVAMQQSVGLTEVEALEGDVLFDRFPWVDECHLGGTWCPTDGFLRPLLVYAEAARRVRELGGTLRQNCPVLESRQVGGRLSAVRVPDGWIEADLFIDCTNAWTSRVGELLGAELLPVEAFKRYLWFIAREGMPADTLAAMPLVVTPGGIYCRPENPDTLLMGRKHNVHSEPDFSYEDQDTIEPEMAHDGDVDALPYEFWAELAESIPAVGDFAGLTATSGGFYGTTPDHNPFLGFDRQVGNLIRLVGFSGHGAMMGPFTAKVGAALTESGTDLPSLMLDEGEVDLSVFALGREPGDVEQLVI